MPDFPADAFAGTARAYLRYRPPYPAVMLDDLIRRAGITGSGTLLDLGCGPGRVTLPLARHFSRIVAVDVEPEMIEVGREASDRIDWRVGRAEALDLPAGSVNLVTFGESFHRMNKPLILERVKRWLAPSGALATLGLNKIFQNEAPWHAVVCDVMRKWTGGWAEPKPRAESRKFWTHDADLLSSGFSGVSSFEFLVPHVWTADDIVGYMDATSGASRRILGDRADACHAELKAALLEFDPRGEYADTLWFAYTLARP